MERLPALPRRFDGRGPRIEGVLHQFLEDGGRTLHHLAGGELVDEGVGEDADFRQGGKL